MEKSTDCHYLICHMIPHISRDYAPYRCLKNNILVLTSAKRLAMSYYFTILSPSDAPLFNIAFGTSKSGGDGIARFRFPDSAQYMNQFIIHSSLDIVEEAQWMNGNLYDTPFSLPPSKRHSFPLTLLIPGT